MPRASSRSSRSADCSFELGLVEQRSPVARRVDARPQELQREADAEQALLRAVVEVALEAPPLGVARLDEPHARRAQLRELAAELRMQPLVLEREARSRARRLEQ